MDIERNSTQPWPANIARSGHKHAMASAAGMALDRMRALAEEADPARTRVTTATALFALCDMARARMYRGTRVFGLFEDAFAGRWSRLATERARYIAGRAADLDEQPSAASRLSTNAQHALSIARMLAGTYAMARPMMVEDVVLGLLLCTPTSEEPVAAHAVLHRLDLTSTELVARFVELADA